MTGPTVTVATPAGAFVGRLVAVTPTAVVIDLNEQRPVHVRLDRVTAVTPHKEPHR